MTVLEEYMRDLPWGFVVVDLETEEEFEFTGVDEFQAKEELHELGLDDKQVEYVEGKHDGYLYIYVCL